MLLEHLSICNYGVYAGKNDFDLSSTPQKPIVLIGGFNGAGKTTILESMMIALYGRAYFGIKRSKKEYLGFVYDKIHRSNKKRADSASVEIAFRFYHAGYEDRYVITRSWQVEGASVTESFSVKKNDEMMNDVNESQWQSFIEGLLPLGIAKLFFFDGEKIVRVTENKGKNNDEIKTSLETMIGAELVHRLHADLDLYMVRKSDTKNDLPLQYDVMNKEKKQVVSDIQSLLEEKEKKSTELDFVNAKITEKESLILGIGGGYADIRSKLLSDKAVLEEKMNSLTKQIQEELAFDAPFHLIPSLLERVNDQLKKDLEVSSKKGANVSAKLIEHELKNKLESATYWPDNTDGKALTAKILDTVREISTPVKEETIFDLSDEDTVSIMQVMKKIKAGHTEFSNILDSYADMMADLEKTEIDIARIPKDDELGPRIYKINQMHQEVGLLQGEIIHIDQQIASKKSFVKILQNKLRVMIKSIHHSQSVSAGIQLASKMQAVLDAYYTNLKEQKIKELESNLLDTTKLLLHKESIRKIRIDRDTFEIKVYENDDDQIPGDLLSMGERQIVGTALLWAIARTCGRSLPFVIDTPLGRLDGQHLSNLTDRFYPFASHQMILLSTDREIGYKEYERLLPHISNSYRIECNQSKSVTSVVSGYFMEEEIAST